MTNDYTATVYEAGGAMGVPGFRGNNQPSKTQDIGTDSYLQKKKKKVFVIPEGWNSL